MVASNPVIEVLKVYYPKFLKFRTYHFGAGQGFRRVSLKRPSGGNKTDRMVSYEIYTSPWTPSFQSFQSPVFKGFSGDMNLYKENYWFSEHSKQPYLRKPDTLSAN